MKTVLATFFAALIIAFGVAMAQEHEPSAPASSECKDPGPDKLGLKPGDYGYQHQKLHCIYKEVFSTMKCSCGSGNCRPTKWRGNPNSPSGIDVEVNGEMLPVPQGAIRYTKDFPGGKVPPEILAFQAHVCATPTKVIECVFFRMDA